MLSKSENAKVFTLGEKYCGRQMSEGEPELASPANEFLFYRYSEQIYKFI